ncbi:putative non-ribosomal peptide synthetase [Xylaria palmicola]|nr:putative non-ribosomal peptide synthetase [Xylaria palmicola]
MLPDHSTSLHPGGLSIVNAKPKRLSGPCFLHQLVSLTSSNGQSAAIDFLSENGQHVILSYSELHAASLGLAYNISCTLRTAPSPVPCASKARDPLIIPILSPQSPQLYVAILAILNVGGAFCPLNADAPPDRVRFILNDVKAEVVLVSRDLAAKLPVEDKSLRIIFIDDIFDCLERKGNNLTSHHELNPEDVAYVMYTSGSTGTPKGVAVSHLAATQSILAHERHIPSFTRFLQFAAPTFDVSIFEIFFPLFRGATLVGCNRAEMLTDLAGVLERMKVDACELTPSVAGSLLRQRSRAPGLRLLLTIGEMLTEPVIREFGGNGDKLSILWGVYGPTEAAIHCTVQAAFATTLEKGTVGIPFDTVSAFIIRVPSNSDGASQFEILPMGEVGELALGGYQLATCYLNRPEQTENSFVQTPWGRVYRTGDKARIRPDGTIECLGRIGEGQVKLNGQRLELGEIEQVLLRTPGCHSAFVAVLSNVLVAFAAVEQVSDSSAQLWTQCRSWLPAFMVPTDIVTMEQLPQLPSGKIDKKRLTNEYMARMTAVAPSHEAIDDRERLLCEVATAIIGEQVGPLTEFTAAKLDSLAAIEYASALRDKGLSFSPMDILNAKTPRELRQKIVDTEVSTPIPELEHQQTHPQFSSSYIDKASLKPILGEKINEVDRVERLTSLQESMISETLKGARSYINQVEFELTSHVTLDILHSSLRMLAECNEILRTGFAFTESQLCQVIWKRLDDSQLNDLDEKRTEDKVGDVELFLLRPLKIEIRHPSPGAKYFTLLLTLHHAIYDGWTVDLMIEDLSLLLRGKLPIKRPQFSQIMRGLRQNHEANTVDSMEFWTEHLRGIGAATPPNFRTVIVPKPELTVTTTMIPLHPSILKNTMLEVMVGPQVLFQACLVWLWAAVLGTEDIAIGCVSSGRSLPLPGIDKLMGPCMMTLPLRINISRHRTITELLQNIHSINREVLRHGHIPLPDIIKAAGLSTNSKLFDVIFAYQETPASRRESTNMLREIWHRDATEAKLLVEIQPCEDHFICHTTFQTDFFPQHLAEVFARHLSDLVEYLSSHFNAPLDAIPKCFPLKSLSQFNEKPRTIETYSSIPKMVERSASRYSSSAALCFATSIGQSDITSESLSYHGLNLKANQIARHLQRCGISSGSVIAIIMNKSPLLYCSILGILKTGCAYLPILPSTPSERVKAIFNQAEPCLCVVDTISSTLVVGQVSAEIVNMERVALSSYLDSNLGICSRPSDLAYVIYTSGTTGTPKGVAVTNRNILSNISSLSAIYPYDQNSRLLQACSQAFDVSVFEIFFTWANGMCLCTATNDTLFEDLEHAVRSFEITHLSPTVTVASLLKPANVPSVRFLVTSGEPMTDEVLDMWSEHLYQGYGPSETTNICTVRKVSKGDSSQFLGWSFENTSTFVFYPNSTDLVPVGCIGELCFGGDQVASGYLKLPEATAAKFINHPNYGRLYRSGDLGRMLPDGSLIIQGRIDTQVKLRGLRIELREVQAIALRTGLAHTCRSVIIDHGNAGFKQLSLFYVPFNYDTANFQLLSLTNELKEQIRTLRHAFQAFLPDYMIPTFIFPISTLPITSSGKINEHALCSAAGELSVNSLSVYSSTEEQADVHSDWSETETLIVNIMADMLKRDKMDISRWTTFSALGLDSISAMPVARKLQSVLRRRIPLSMLLQHPNVNRLASAIKKLNRLEEPASLNSALLPQELEETVRMRITAKGQSVAKVLPCTPLQEAMVMSSLNPTSSANDVVTYYNQMLFHLRVPYELIMSLWDKVVKRHEILRAVFATSDNIRYPAVQIILDNHVPEWQVLDTDGASLLERASQHVASTSTTTDRDKPPMGLAIIRTQDSGDYLSFVCHHAMYDGMSMGILLSEIEALYHSKPLPEPPSLEPFLRELKLPRQQQDEFWRALFFGFHPKPLRCTPCSKDTMPRSVFTKTPATSLKHIESQLRDIGVSMLALIQTAWAITLSIINQNSDVSFGSIVNGRSIALDGVENLVAPCFNTLPVRLDLSRSIFFIEVLKSFQSLNAEIMLYQFTSLRHIQKQTDAQTHLFDTLVILQPPTAPLDDTIWSLVHEDGLMDIPIVCEVTPSELQDTLNIQLHRDRSKFSLQALELIGSIFSHVLDACLKHPFSHFSTRMMLPDTWQKDIQALFDGSERPQTSNGSSSQTPDHEETWSQSELTIRQTLAKLAEIPEDQIRRHTPIYRYGLDSITAVQLATLLRQQKIHVSAIDVIEHPTCAGIAAAEKELIVEDFFGDYDFSSFQTQVNNEITECGIDPEIAEAVLPCTAAQQGMLTHFLESKGQYYFNYSSWALDTPASLDSTIWALSQLVNHHQILRTGFVPVDSPESSFAMVIHRMNHFTAPVAVYESDAFEAEKWISDATADALDTLTRPPWRIALVKSGPADSNAPLIIHLAIHHALYDAFTLRNLLQNLGELIFHGIQPEVANIDIALSHYLGLAQSGFSAGEAFWTQKAEDFSSHKFPVMTPLHINSPTSSTVSRTCETPSSKLRHAASKFGITMQAALQAAWARLLSVYIGESRITFGVVLDGRTTDLARKATLPMITTLPVIAENVASNSELVQQMMQYNSELRRFQFIPISQIQRFLGATSPLFDTILIYQAEDKAMNRPPFSAVKELASVEYSVSLEVEESYADTTRLNLVFRDRILPQEQATLLLNQFEFLLMDILRPAENATPCLDIARPEIFSILPPISECLPVESDLLHGLLEHSAQHLPSAIALEFIDETTRFSDARRWSYQELDALGNRVANFIIGHGVGPGSIIATCFNKCPTAYFTLLGILKAGCAFLCLDSSAPAARQIFTLEDSNAAMLILNENFDWVHELSLPVHIIDEAVLEPLPISPPLLKRQISPSESCYCLYTSGTTGTPKGCLITHENAVQAMAAFKYLFTGRWASDSRWLQFAAFHFDVSVLEQYWSWFVGITVVAAPKDVILSDLATTISKLRITHIDLTPSLARLITPDECPSLCKGVFITGGEKLRSDILDTWGSHRVIHNAYGPTEATIGITMYRGVPENGRPSNIGNLFPNVGAYIFERGSEIPVLRGGVGELCVSGKLVGKGYLNRDALTAERFPVIKSSGDRIYRTGDLVRVLHDDSLDFLGRADDQVKLRGQRLEIGEINHAIREGLADKAGDVATLVARRRGQDIDHLVSFVTPTSNSGSAHAPQIYYDAKHIEFAKRAQEACRSRLAIYMVPSFIICISRIPLSTNNKVEINQLKKLFSELSQEQLQALSTSSSSGRRELNTVESQVVEAICQVTKVRENDIRPSTTVFQLGIDSISATRLAKQLRGMGLEFATAPTILQHPQISQLSQALTRANSTARDSNSLQVKQSIVALTHRYLGLVCVTLRVNTAEVEYIAPCTPLQQGIIARSKAREAQLAYFNQFQLCLDTAVSIDRLKASLSRIVAANSILRTAFVEAPDGFIQVAIKNRPLRWLQTVLTVESFEEAIAERRSFWIESNQNVLKWPVEMDHIEVNGQHYVFLRLFHGVYDARSLNIILETLDAEYKGQSWPCGPAFLSVLHEGPLLNHQESHQFWKSLLRDHCFQPMPTLTDKPTTTGTLIHQSIELDGFEVRRKELQVTHQTLLQAAWLHTLSFYFAESPTIGVILSGRSLAIDDIDLVVGPLFNTLPLRVELTNDMSWATLAQEIQKHNNGLLAFVHTPLRDIQRLCSNGQPLFDTLFTFDRDYNTTTEDKQTLWSIQDSPTHPDYPLAIELIMSEGNMLHVTLAAQGRIADMNALESLLTQFTDSLNSIIGPDHDVPLPTVARESSLPANKLTLIAIPETFSSGSSTIEPDSDFPWGEKSYDVRREVASLARMDESEITEATNLFALGLDSIDVIKLSGRLSKLGYHVSVGALMKQPTLESIVNGLEKLVPAATDLSCVAALNDAVSIMEDCYRRTAADLSNIEAILPPTPLQDSMVAEMLRSDFHTYFNHDVLELPQDIQIDRLKSALSTVYETSPILRTIFMEVDDPRVSSAYYQVIRKQALEIAPTSKLSSLDDISKLTDQARNRALEGNGTSNLFQVHFAESGTRIFMVLSIAHALYDGWSLYMLHKDIQSAYESSYIPRQSYKPYLSQMLSRSGASSKKFWADLLHGAHASLVPKQNTTADHNTMHRLEKKSSRSVTNIRALCKDLRVTPQVVGQACWAAVLASLTESLDVVCGVVLSGRDTEEAEELMFPTMNTVPLRLALHGTVVEFLGYSQDIMSSIIEFQQTPLRDVQRFTGNQGNRLFNTIFLLQNSRNDDANSSSFLKSAHSVSAVDYPLCAELELAGDNAVWRVACDENYMGSDDLDNIAISLERVLDYFARDGNGQVLSFSSNGSQVSVCGLEPLTFQPNPIGQEGDQPIEEHIPQQTTPPQAGHEALLDVLSDLSRVDRHEIDLGLSIFHIGLDSISAIKASSMLRKRGLNISTRDLVTIPSIRGILKQAGRVISEETEASASSTLRLDWVVDEKRISTLTQEAGLDTESIETILPALPMQVHMLSVWQNSGGVTFFPKFTFRVSGSIDLVTASKAWTVLVDEIAILRTHLLSTASSSSPFFQVVLKSKFASRYAKRVATESDSRWEFIYSATPFYVVQVIREKPGEVYLKLHIHHALYDGISLPIILNRFAELCNSTSLAGTASQSAPWCDFALKHLTAQVKTQRELFWTSYLNGVTLARPFQMHQAATSHQVSRINLFRSTPIKNAAALRLRCHESGVSTQVLLFAAYTKALAKWICRDENSSDIIDCVFGVYLANRSGHYGIEDAPFPTLNILPLRVKDPLNRDIAVLAVDIQKDMTEISRFEHSTASLWEIRRWTGVCVDTFVNILAIPSDLAQCAPNSITLEKVTNGNLSPMQSTDISTYLVAPDSKSEGVDIELALRDDVLDLGIFCPSGILSDTQASDVVTSILGEIEAL